MNKVASMHPTVVLLLNLILIATLSRNNVGVDAKPSSSSRRRRIEYHLPNDMSKKKKKTHQHRVFGAINNFFRQTFLGCGTTTTVNNFVTNDKSIIDIHHERRVGAWCSPLTVDIVIDAAREEEMPVELVDKSLVACNPSDLVVSTVVLDNSDTNTNNNNNNCLAVEILPGMVMYVFPGARVKGGWKIPSKGSSVVEDISSSDLIYNEASYSIVEIDGSRIHGSRCTLELGKQYDHDNQVIQYTLLHREPIELGNIVVHREDFAYRPVEASSVVFEDEYKGSNDATASYELEMLPSLTTTIQDSLNNHENENVDNQQVSFRWWSWLSDFSQLFYNKGGSGNTNEDYPYQRIIYEEDGRRSFAGGSHGEIWRARRRCPIKVVEEDEKTTETDDNGTSSDERTFHSSCDDGRDLIVKRLKIEHGYPVLEAGLREVYLVNS